MSPERQEVFGGHAKRRNVWVSTAHNKLNNDLAALFVATTVDLYLADNAKFGFVLPESALKGPHWASFREGKWGKTHAGKEVKADLYKAWNLGDIKDAPFNSASCVVFGEKTTVAKKLDSWLDVSGREISFKSDWSNVENRLIFKPNRKWVTESGSYSSKKFRRGAMLTPQSLVVAEKVTKQHGGLLRFETKIGKSEDHELVPREGEVEKEYAHKTIFSKYLVHFGMVGYAYLIAPIRVNNFVDLSSEKGKSEMMIRH